MGRKILLITTDQQRHDALGCNGGKVARTPAIDGLAASGLNFRQARNQNTVCMPERATILTGQSIRAHGVTSNGRCQSTGSANLSVYAAKSHRRPISISAAPPTAHISHFAGAPFASAPIFSPARPM